MSTSKKAYAILCSVFLFFTIATILNGAFVRSTGSGAGCGSHWPLCNGEVVPHLDLATTIIEFIHRISSAGVTIGAVVLVFGAFFLYPRKSPVRFASVLTLIFTAIEGLLGAGLVLFDLVENNSSLVRMFVLCLHQINTFALLAAIGLSATWSFQKTPSKWQVNKSNTPLLLCLFAFLLIGATGTITALGDALYLHANTTSKEVLKEAIYSHSIIKSLRVFHPFITLLLVGSILSYLWSFISKSTTAKEKRSVYLITALFAAQIVFGVLNIYFKAPTSLQLLHLLSADIIWILLILLCDFRNKTTNNQTVLK